MAYTKAHIFSSFTQEQQKLAVPSTAAKEPPSYWPSWPKILVYQWNLLWIFVDIAYYFFPTYLKSLYCFFMQIHWGITDIIFDNFIYDYLPTVLQDLFYHGAYFPYEILNYLFDHLSVFVAPASLLSLCSPYKYILLALIYDYFIYQIFPSQIKSYLIFVAYAPFTFFNYLFHLIVYPLFPASLKQLFVWCNSWKNTVAMKLLTMN